MGRVPRRSPETPRRAPTIREVAVRAAVSVATVSAVVNGSRPVRPEVRQRVEEAIRELGYRPNRLARALQTRRSRTLALVVPSLGNPLFVRLADAVETACHRSGYALFVASSQGRPARVREQAERLMGLGVDGVLAALAWDVVEGLPWAELAARGVPVVGAAGTRVVPAVDRFVVDDEDAGRLAGEHLRELGHRVVGFLGVADSLATEVRSRGVAAGLGPGGRLVCSEALGHGEAEGAAATRELLRRAADLTAVVALNDAMAVGALEALREAGRPVPGRVSVVGFGDTVAAFAHPKLTTLAYPTDALGEQAVERLLARLHGRADPPQVCRAAARLLVRASTGPAPGVAAEPPPA